MSFSSRLESLEILGIKFGLDNIRAILRSLGNPENDFPSILIAGTNGKGSVAAMLDAVLQKNSFQSGLYTSPHLVNVRERIRINGNPISEMDFEGVLQKVFNGADSALESPPTYFEVLTAAAMLHFKNCKVDYGVIEVGMGGRYDATNAVSQKLSIVTSIDYDHEMYLGRSLESIAAEKAAISKNGIPMITGSLPPEAFNVVQAQCLDTASELQSVDLSNIVDITQQDGRFQFSYVPWNERVRLNLRGRHQIQNAAIVLLAADQLGLTRSRTLQALAEVNWPGRLEIVPGHDPAVLLDCAHNPMGVQSLVGFLDDIGWKKVIVLFTAMRDKNISDMLRLLSPLTHQAFLTQVEPLRRCATGEALKESATLAGMNAHFDPSLEKALQQALQCSQESHLPLVIFGSIYLIGVCSTRFRPGS